MTGRSVAFLRNLNLGQARTHSPTRAQLLEAFTSAGASEASSFQVNGTVVFTATDPVATAEDAVERLTASCGYADTVVVRPGPWVLEVAASVAVLPPTSELALFEGPAAFPEPLPWTPPRGRMRVVAADDRHALVVNDVERTSFATPELERLLGVPVTSRGGSTVLRLAVRLAARLADETPLSDPGPGATVER